MGIDMDVVLMIVAVLGLGVILFVIRSMRMPGGFLERQRAREELRKALVATRFERAKSDREDKGPLTPVE